MLSSSASALLRLAGWTYLPDLATHNLLRLFHHLSRTPAPRPRTPTYITHYRLCFALTVLSYLLYNLIEASRSMSPNLYEVLGVEPDADEGALKAAFRGFARKNHPDRVGVEGQVVFIQVRDAFEALKDPTKRFAYDRFGPDALEWSHCTTVREYLRHGLVQSTGFHIVSGLILLFLSAVGKPSPVAFWRYLLFLALFAAELALRLGPSPSSPSTSHYFLDPLSPSFSPPNALTLLFPRRVAYQHVLFLHQLFMFLTVAVSRVAPVVFPPEVEEVAWMDARVWAGVVERMGGLVGGLDREATNLLRLHLHSIRGPQPTHVGFQSPMPPCARPPEGTMERLREEMENMIVESKLRSAAEVGVLRSVWRGAVGRGREGWAAGAEEREQGQGQGQVPEEQQDEEIEEEVEGEREKFHDARGEERERSPEIKIEEVPIPEFEPWPARDRDRDESVGLGKLLSPRPSPDPPAPMLRRSSTFPRARSISC